MADKSITGPHTITFTGIGPENSRRELEELLAADPRIELGILYSESRAGSGRYPPAQWIRETAEWIGFKRVALHVCGRAVKKVIGGEPLDAKIGSFWHFHRVQLNGRFDGLDAARLRHFIGPESLAYKVITQYDGNAGLHDFCRRPSHQVLFDSSGGRGVLREQWPRSLPDHACGYGGGLGPENLRDEIPRIAAAAAPGKYWVDMESSLRDDADHFSIARARLALDAIRDAERRPWKHSLFTAELPVDGSGFEKLGCRRCMQVWTVGYGDQRLHNQLTAEQCPAGGWEATP